MNNSLFRIVATASMLLIAGTVFAEVPIETGIIDAFATLKISTYVIVF